MPLPPDPAVLIIAEILQTSLCIECIAEATDLSQTHVAVQLDSVASVIDVAETEATCEICDGTKRVFRIL